MGQQQPQSWLMKLATKALKYYLLSLAGCTIIYVISAVLKLDPISNFIIVVMEQMLLRSLVLVFCLGAVAVIAESLPN